MKTNILHTPEGLRDIYNDEYIRKSALISKLNNCIKNYGFLPISTPTFEYLDIFGNEVGTISEKEMFKFFDKEGNTLCLRPDFTPSIARAVAKYYLEDKRPIRLSYEGNVFINHNNLQGRLKESTQIGGEFIGDASVDADAEVLALVVNALIASGIKEFQISVGHAMIFDGLITAAGFQDDETEEIRNLISNKNFFGALEFIDGKEMNDNLKKLFAMLYNMYQSPDDFKEAILLSENYPTVHQALMYFEELNSLLKLYGVDKYIAFEPGLLSNYRYYTGIIFTGYTYGSGQPVVSGGRYDKLMNYFGKDAAAIGFAIYADRLLTALERNNIEITDSMVRNILIYTKDRREEAISNACDLRRYGSSVELIPFSGSQEELNELKELYHKHNVNLMIGALDS